VRGLGWQVSHLIDWRTDSASCPECSYHLNTPNHEADNLGHNCKVYGGQHETLGTQVTRGFRFDRSKVSTEVSTRFGYLFFIETISRYPLDVYLYLESRYNHLAIKVGRRSLKCVAVFPHPTRDYYNDGIPLDSLRQDDQEPASL
jgi:hypothetical protein